MKLNLLLLNYGVISTIVLTVVAIRSQYYQKLYQNVLWDHQSLERIRKFFQNIDFLLQVIYPVIDRLDKPIGRPATSRRFQFWFLLWWKFFAPGPQETAIRKLNESLQLQKLLDAPLNPYTRSSLRRFLQDLGETGLIKMIGLIVTNFIKTGLIDASKMVIDSFPIYSYLNYLKCLKMPHFNRKFAKRFYQELSLDAILKLFPKQHGRSSPLTDKVKALIHHYLWDIPSDKLNYNLIFGKAGRGSVMGLQQGWKTARTYQNFITTLISLPNRGDIESKMVTEVVRVLQVLGVRVNPKKLQRISDLCQVFHQPHRLKDLEITLNYCAAKDHYFMGRGGILAIFPNLELPFFIQTTPKYKQNVTGILTFLKTLDHFQGKTLQNLEVYADSEFGTNEVETQLRRSFRATSYIPNYGNSKDKLILTSDQKQIRKTIERVIGRLETNFSLEHSPFLGNEVVACHTQLCVLCDLLLTSFNISSGNHAHPHSLRMIRG